MARFWTWYAWVSSPSMINVFVLFEEGSKVLDFPALFVARRVARRSM